MTNESIAQRLWEEARRLDRESNLYRVRAYRRAAEVISFLRIPITDLIARGGRRALEDIPGIGGNLARSIMELLRSGEWSYEEKEKLRRVG